MTFSPSQIRDTAEWDREHQAHEVEEKVDRYPLTNGAAKVLKWKVCKTCHKRHLYSMEEATSG
jgi:hypothetical protein